MADKFYVFLAHMLVEVGENFFQCIPCFLHRQQFGIRDYPKAELIVFQSGLEKRDQDVKEILSCLVEGTEVRAPGHISHYADSRFPEFWRHWSGLQWIRTVRLGRLLCESPRQSSRQR